ncbi:hypothetical protein ACFWSF_21845 [Streptomyces sp. NPDC058611]|uniref:hypothetical protein n=1 Tax=unclassified Streptomyces TaxID=2593676 RepID=UPI0036571D7F
MARFRTSLSPARFAGGLSLVVAPFLFTAVGTAQADPAPPPYAGTAGHGPCDVVKPASGLVCVPAPTQCFTAPCPQYDIVPAVPGPAAAPEPTPSEPTPSGPTVPDGTAPAR